MVSSGNRKTSRKTVICEMSKGEVIKSWKRLEMIPKLPQKECSLKNKGRKRDVKFQYLIICNLYVKSAEVINNNNNNNNNNNS